MTDTVGQNKYDRDRMGWNKHDKESGIGQTCRKSLSWGLRLLTQRSGDVFSSHSHSHSAESLAKFQDIEAFSGNLLLFLLLHIAAVANIATADPGIDITVGITAVADIITAVSF